MYMLFVYCSWNFGRSTILYDCCHGIIFKRFFFSFQFMESSLCWVVPQISMTIIRIQLFKSIRCCKDKQIVVDGVTEMFCCCIHVRLAGHLAFIKK